MLWPELENPVKLDTANPANWEPLKEPSTPNIEVQEMMALLRQQKNTVLSAPEKFLAPVLKALDRKASVYLPGQASYLPIRFTRYAHRLFNSWTAINRLANRGGSFPTPVKKNHLHSFPSQQTATKG